jgi:hypothetical protein
VTVPPTATVPAPDRPHLRPAADPPEPGAVALDAFVRLLRRLGDIAAEWTPEWALQYARELPALLPHLAPQECRDRFHAYARAVAALNAYDDMPERDRVTEWGPDHICERAERATERDWALAHLVSGHPYAPDYSAALAVDPLQLAETVERQRHELLRVKTALMQERIRRRHADVLNAELTEVVDALGPVPYVVTPDRPLAAVKDTP